jgi:hypothetical protein
VSFDLAAEAAAPPDDASILATASRFGASAGARSSGCDGACAVMSFCDASLFWPRWLAVCSDAVSFDLAAEADLPLEAHQI